MRAHHRLESATAAPPPRLTCTAPLLTLDSHAALPACASCCSHHHDGSHQYADGQHYAAAAGADPTHVAHYHAAAADGAHAHVTGATDGLYDPSAGYAHPSAEDELNAVLAEAAAAAAAAAEAEKAAAAAAAAQGAAAGAPAEAPAAEAPAQQ